MGPAVKPLAGKSDAVDQRMLEEAIGVTSARSPPAASPYALPLPHGLPKAVSQRSGADVLKKKDRKNGRHVFALSCRISAREPGRLGSIAGWDTPHPRLYIDFASGGRLRLQGTRVFPPSSHLVLRLGQKHLVCEDVLESLVIFGKPVWVGTREENPDERELELPTSIEVREEAAAASPGAAETGCGRTGERGIDGEVDPRADGDGEAGSRADGCGEDVPHSEGRPCAPDPLDPAVIPARAPAVVGRGARVHTPSKGQPKSPAAPKAGPGSGGLGNNATVPASQEAAAAGIARQGDAPDVPGRASPPSRSAAVAAAGEGVARIASVRTPRSRGKRKAFHDEGDVKPGTSPPAQPAPRSKRRLVLASQDEDASGGSSPDPPPADPGVTGNQGGDAGDSEGPEVSAAFSRRSRPRRASTAVIDYSQQAASDSEGGDGDDSDGFRLD